MLPLVACRLGMAAPGRRRFFGLEVWRWRERLVAGVEEAELGDRTASDDDAGVETRPAPACLFVNFVLTLNHF